MAARAAGLMEMDELVEAFLLRLPPDDPASLVRTALVCKLWRRVLADPGFRHRFRELHRRRAPMLGLLVYVHNERGFRFTPTSSFRPRNADLRGRGAGYAVDARHGRVLLARSLFSPFSPQSDRSLAVWDPISGDWLELPELPAPRHLCNFGIRWNAALLCASSPSACDGMDCHLGHFCVVLMAISDEDRAYVYVYSSQAGTWSKPTSAAIDPLGPVRPVCPIGHGTLVGNELYFEVSSDLSDGVLKYNLGTQQISSVNLPPDLPGECRHSLLTTTEYGGLGIASLQSSRLHLWSGVADPRGHLGWAPSRVIDLNTVLPANICSILLVDFLHDLAAFLVSTNDGVFIVDLESNRARKICRDSCAVNAIPYMRFCTPAAHVAPMDTGEGAGVSLQFARRAQVCGQRMKCLVVVICDHWVRPLQGRNQSVGV